MLANGGVCYRANSKDRKRDLLNFFYDLGSSRGLGKAAVVAAVEGNTYQVSLYIYFLKRHKKKTHR